jgi:two-component system, cell cycle sensor histidine kinase and response regulator CckA
MEHSPVAMQKLHIIHLEDNPHDATLVAAMLESADISCELHVVYSRQTFEQELKRERIDLILSDFSMPAFNGLNALQIARVARPEVPFIFVSGAIGEESAIESLRNGASDYLIKDRLARLPAAVKRAIKESEERRRLQEAEGALREREAMFASFMNFNPAVAFLKDREGRHLYVNEPFERVFQCTRQQWFHKTDTDFFPAECARQLRQNDLAVLDSKRPLQTIEVVPGPDGNPRHWFVCKFPLERGGETLLGGLAIDITEQKELEQKFLRAQRMESLGTLAGGIAHDLNNALLPVLLGLEVLREKHTAADDQTILDLLQTSASRGAAMVKQVLTFARGADGEKLTLNPAHVLRDVAQIAERTMPGGIAVRSDVVKDLWSINGDPTQLHQVLLNFAVNARDAMPHGGKLTFRASNVAASEVHDLFSADVAAGDYVLLEVSDTGTGIPMEVREKIFDPFFTTKEIGKGTGLGLSTSLGIVKNHGGFVDFQTEIGKGTTFRVYLPAVQETQTQNPIQAKQSPASGHAEVVLVVDDEAGPREVARLVLGRHAYQVITAENGAEALNIFRRFRHKISAVILDSKMPLMTGPETARAIRELNKDVKIIGVTGQATDLLFSEFMESGANVVVPKPFTAQQILSALHTLLHPAA